MSLASLPDDLLTNIFGRLTLVERHRALPLVSRRCWQLLCTPQLLETIDVRISNAGGLDMRRLRSLVRFLHLRAAGSVRRLQLDASDVLPADFEAHEYAALVTTAASACSSMQELHLDVTVTLALSEWLLPVAGSLRRLCTGDNTEVVVAADLSFLTALKELECAPGGDHVSFDEPARLPLSLTSLALGNDRGERDLPSQIGSLVNLRHLYLRHPYHNAASYAPLTRLALRTLELVGNVPALPSCLSRLTTLEALAVDARLAEFFDAAQTAAMAECLCTAVPRLTGLTRLALRVCDPAPLACLTALTSLRSLLWCFEPADHAAVLPAGSWLDGLQTLAAPDGLLLRSLPALGAAQQLQTLCVYKTRTDAAPLRSIIRSSLLQHLRELAAASGAVGSRAASGVANGPARRLPEDGLGLADFVAASRGGNSATASAASSASDRAAAAAAASGGAPPATGAGEAGVEAQSSGGRQRTAFVETYGCQMNVNDSEVVAAVLRQAGFAPAAAPEAADVVLLNTCAIRENAESKVFQRLGYYKNLKAAARRARRPPPVVGVLGCMAERLKQRLLESDRLVDVVAGPDAYRDLPRLIDIVQGSPASGSGRGGGAMNVQLSADETYADIVPVRQPDAQSAFLSILRGCNNLCAFCIVPYTRGRERSRPLASIVDEVRMLSEQGVREVTLLGQNVNSYADFSAAGSGSGSSSGSGTSISNGAAAAAAAAGEDPFEGVYARGFRSVYKPRRQGAATFAELLAAVAAVDPEMRVRFTSPHPKDFSDDVLQVIAEHPNVCKQLHMPAQSGATSMLERMRRGYSREAYDELVAHVRAVLPQVALSTDMIVGFCGETEEEHAASLDLMQRVGYDQAFLFAYSMREKTHAARHYQDDVPEPVKQRRLEEIISVYRRQLYARQAAELGRRHLVLVEGRSRRSEAALTGRTDTFKRVVFDDALVPASYAPLAACGGAAAAAAGPLVQLRPGDYVAVEITSAGGTLRGRPLARTTLREFVAAHGSAAPLEAWAAAATATAAGGPVGLEVLQREAAL